MKEVPAAASLWLVIVKEIARRFLEKKSDCEGYKGHKDNHNMPSAQQTGQYATQTLKKCFINFIHSVSSLDPFHVMFFYGYYKVR